MLTVFTPSTTVIARIRGMRSLQEIQDEPMLFSASPEFAKDHGGPITQTLVDLLMNEVLLPLRPWGRKLEAAPEWKGLEVVIDTRTHMLMKGMIPAIPGWHCDGLVRPEKYAQPLLDSADPRVAHYAVFFATALNVSRTVFIDHSVQLEVDETRVWGSVDEKLSRMERCREVRLYPQHEGELLRFDEHTLHRASPCEEPGWRFFFRLSVTREPVRDQIRKQTQVYTTSSKGW